MDAFGGSPKAGVHAPKYFPPSVSSTPGTAHRIISASAPHETGGFVKPSEPVFGIS